MTVDWRQNPDGTLVRGTRISSYRKLCVITNVTSVSNKLIVGVGCGKGQRMVAFVSYSFFGFSSFTSLRRLTHTTHTLTKHKLSVREMRRGQRISIGMICGWEGSGQAQGHLLGVWARGSSAQTGRVFETAAYEAWWAYKNWLTWPRKNFSGFGSFSLLYFSLLHPNNFSWSYLAESSRSLSIEGKWDDLPLDRRLSLELKLLFFLYFSM